MRKQLLSVVASIVLIQGAWAAIPPITTLSWEVESGGSDTANAGCMSNISLAGMATDGAATSATTSAPVFTSASYNFVAGDANSWLFVPAGTNWIAGWYKIVSVASNAATLDAAIGHAQLLGGGLNTVVGVATTASPIGATWTVDYTRRTTPIYSLTDLVAATTTTITSATHSFGKEDVGNCIIITAGTGWTVGTYQITAAVTGTATVDRAIATMGSTGGSGAVGGALATPTYFAGFAAQNSNHMWMQGPTITMPSNTPFNGSFSVFEGYSAVRGDGVRTTLQPNNNVSFTQVNSGGLQLLHVTFNCNSQANTGLINGQTSSLMYDIVVQNCNNTNFALQLNGGTCVRCLITASSNSTPIYLAGNFSECHICWVYGSSASLAAIRITSVALCISCGAVNTAKLSAMGGAGLDLEGQAVINGFTSYGNAGDGILISSGFTVPLAILNTVSSNNGGWGVNVAGAPLNPFTFDYNAYGNNALGNLNNINAGAHDVTLSVDPFVSCATNNCALNNTAGGGKALKGTGFPGVLATGTGVIDIGALQSGSAAGGGQVSFGFSQ